MTMLLVYRFLVPRKTRDARFEWPRPESYSLTVKPIPAGMSANDFQSRFLNQDQIIQTALVKDCGALFRAMEVLFDLDRRIKQMDINLLETPHVARERPGLFNCP